MSTFRLIGMALLALCMNFTSCSDDNEEDPNVYYAYGINFGTNLSTKTDYFETELKINEVEQIIKFKPESNPLEWKGGSLVT